MPELGHQKKKKRQRHFDHQTVRQVGQDRGVGGAGEAAKQETNQESIHLDVQEARQRSRSLSSELHHDRRGKGGEQPGAKLDKHGHAQNVGQNVVAQTGQEGEQLQGAASRVVDEGVPTFHDGTRGEDDQLLKPKPNSALK